MQFGAMIIHLTEVFCSLKHNADWVAAANRVLRPLEVLVEYGRIHRRDRVHSLAIQRRNLLMNWRVIVRVVWRKAKARSPMAEVAADHKQVVRIGDVLREDLPIRRLARVAQRTDEHRDDGKRMRGAPVLLHHFRDEWQLHFDGMLRFLVVRVHRLKGAGAHQLFIDLSVDVQVAERRFVAGASG